MQGSLVKGNFSYSGALDPRDRSQGSDKWSDFEYNFNMRLRGFNSLDMMEEMKMWINWKFSKSLLCKKEIDIVSHFKYFPHCFC